jgi:hypothetical protein
LGGALPITIASLTIPGVIVMNAEGVTPDHGDVVGFARMDFAVKSPCVLTLTNMSLAVAKFDVPKSYLCQSCPMSGC